MASLGKLIIIGGNSQSIQFCRPSPPIHSCHTNPSSQSRNPSRYSQTTQTIHPSKSIQPSQPIQFIRPRQPSKCRQISHPIQARNPRSTRHNSLPSKDIRAIQPCRPRRLVSRVGLVSQSRQVSIVSLGILVILVRQNSHSIV